MRHAQPGIFALGTASHAYLEFDAGHAERRAELVRTIASMREPRTTMGGVNLVAGFRPELWREIAPGDLPSTLEGFNADVVGSDGFVMPATQHDAVLWLSGSAYDVIFEVSRAAIAELAGIASVAEETSSWPYRQDRDLTGFIDGTENPTLVDAPDVAVIADNEDGAGGTILLLQKWAHDASAWESLSEAEQEQVIGRRKLDSTELDDKPEDSHVASTDQDRFGEDLPPQHALRHRDRPWDDVRGLQRRPAAAPGDAGEHGRPRGHSARRADEVHARADRRVLLHPVDRVTPSAVRGASFQGFCAGTAQVGVARGLYWANPQLHSGGTKQCGN